LTPRFELEAHSSPTGLAFYTGSQFPESYQNDLFVALHGSGEGSEAAGYKIIRIPLGGGEHGPVQDFAVGWLTEDGTPWGSPVDILVGPDGSLYISDDTGGIIYRIYYSKQ
jgi:glucose/arabinose dehydrogenase